LDDNLNIAQQLLPALKTAKHLHHSGSYYSLERHHKLLKKPTTADVFYGRKEEILEKCEKIKRNTLTLF
tara:strand:+ start:1169 stop:1375 length:207 start_codon:yes stop_codon:yes gene_type:complete